MNHYQIFISYRREGGDALAGRLADRFTALGYSVFYDVESMRSGAFNHQILDAIAQCNDVLVILPPNALDRCIDADDWLRQELAFALQKNKNVIPILMRGFEFPKTLPEDIDRVRYMEGIITPSNEWFDAAVERIEKLLISHVERACHYTLETKEHYKIKTPLFNIYKRTGDLRRGQLQVAAFTERLYYADNAHFHWQPPMVADRTISSLRDFLAIGCAENSIKWYDKHKDRIASIRDKAIALQAYTDLYFYNHALLFAMGSLISLPINIIRTYPSHLREVFCYCLDFPCEKFGDLETLFHKDNRCYEEFRNYLPLAFDVWIDQHRDTRLDSDYQQRFDSFSVMLFDFMIDLSMLILDTCRDTKLTEIRTAQIRCYYKWLKKNHIYLPKELQEKIYRYL